MMLDVHQPGFMMPRGPTSAALGFIAVVFSACGGALPGVRNDCPAGETTLDGTCVSQQIADYVACVRAMGAMVASNSAKQLSAAAGVAGVTASTQAEVKDKLEKSYAKVSDENSLEIIHECDSKTGTRREIAATPAGGADTSSQETASNGPTAPPDRDSAAALVGVWHCFTNVDVVPASGAAIHLKDLASVSIVSDNGDGTVTTIDPKDRSCPPGHWSVSGARATALDLNRPCYKGDGGYVIATSGTASVSASQWNADVAGAYGSSSGTGKLTVTSRCTR
jgi:hypothetical protein